MTPAPVGGSFLLTLLVRTEIKEELLVTKAIRREVSDDVGPNPPITTVRCAKPGKLT